MPNENNQSCATPYKTMIGGQALIEGIMMLGPEKKAVVVRKPDGELEDAVYTYREFFRREGIELTYQDCPEEVIPISGDPERLRQVFCNLLDNAAKHGGSGKRIDTSIAPDGDQVAITIRDYGPGIPEEELPHVKYKFYKGSSKARGSGIGLAVCDEIVTRHEGTLDIGNAEGGGCVVTIRLPIRT